MNKNIIYNRSYDAAEHILGTMIGTVIAGMVVPAVKFALERLCGKYMPEGMREEFKKEIYKEKE